MARPDPVYDPKEIIFNQKLADEIGFDLSDLKKKERTALLSETKFLKESAIAQAYAGINLETSPCLETVELLSWGVLSLWATLRHTI